MAQLSSAAEVAESRRTQEKNKNRKILATIFDIVRHLAVENNAFRGLNEDKTSTQQGKFLEEVKFVAKYDSDLHEWLLNHPGNASFLSKDIQNEMIDQIAKHIQESILKEIKQNNYFSVECDEVASHKREFMSLVLRYVFENEIKERVIALKHITDMTGRGLSEVIKKELSKFQLPLTNLLGKTFDGASNMSGCNEGVQRHLTDSGASRSIYFHCYGHSLNLTLGYCAEKILSVASVFECLGTIYNILKYPLRHEIFKKNILKHKIKQGKSEFTCQSSTRWTARVDNLNCFLNVHPALCDTLEELKWNDVTCRGLLLTISSFDFIFKAITLQHVFTLAKYSSEYLQKKRHGLCNSS